MPLSGEPTGHYYNVTKALKVNFDHHSIACVTFALGLFCVLGVDLRSTASQILLCTLYLCLFNQIKACDHQCALGLQHFTIPALSAVI